MKNTEIARVYNCSLRTGKRWVKANAPVDKREEMLAWIEKQRSRTGVGKYASQSRVAKWRVYNRACSRSHR